MFFGLSLFVAIALGGFWMMKNGSVSANTNPESIDPFTALNQIALDSETEVSRIASS